MSDTDDEVLVTAEMPGLEEKDFELNLTGDLLTLKGEKRHEHEEKEKRRGPPHRAQLRQLPADASASVRGDGGEGERRLPQRGAHRHAAQGTFGKRKVHRIDVNAG